MQLTVCAFYINIHASGRGLCGWIWRKHCESVCCALAWQAAKLLKPHTDTHSRTMGIIGPDVGPPTRSHLIPSRLPAAPARLYLRMRCHISVISINMLAAQKATRRRPQKCLRICISACYHRSSEAVESLFKLASYAGLGALALQRPLPLRLIFQDNGNKSKVEK